MAPRVIRIKRQAVDVATPDSARPLELRFRAVVTLLAQGGPVGGAVPEFLGVAAVWLDMVDNRRQAGPVRGGTHHAQRMLGKELSACSLPAGRVV